MRKYAAAVMALAALGVSGIASATHQSMTVTMAEGDIAVGNPAGKLLFGASEFNAYRLSCPGDGSADGIDGIPFEVPSDAIGRTATLTTTGSQARDADVYWYDVECILMEDLTMGTAAKDETGTVPAGAAYGIVNFTLGAQAHVKLTYRRPLTH